MSGMLQRIEIYFRSTCKGQPALALVIFHLPANAASAGVLSERIVGQLEALEIEVTVILQLIPNIDLTYIGKMMEAVSPVFKIWCILFTESDPRGGWWIDSGSNAGRAGPEEILPHLLDQALEGWAEKSLAAHVVIVSCGLNLQNPEERQKIIGALSKSKWDALIAPSAPAVYSPDFTALLPDLLAQILFIQFDLEPALMRCWLKMPRVRDHTDLFVFSRPSREEEVKGSIWIHSPSWRRPWGIELPAVCCVCSCASSLGKASGWIKRYMRPASSFGEAYYFFSTSCCQYELHLAIFTGPLKLLERHGTQVVIAPLDANGERQFNYAEMCTIKRFPPTAQDKRVQHDNPWTPAGIERKRRMDEKSEAGERT
ncbi:hypothetical protein FRC10_002062 [Ceratobasidium sp. 414]|nr:hypothetical protein FRC10_002062 [Ceratobasidium sp. 414]